MKALTLIGIIGLLFIGRAFLLPVITAVFFWYLTHAISAYYNKVIKKEAVSNILAFGSIVGIVVIFIKNIHPMLSELYMRAPQITAGIEKAMQDFSNTVGFKISFADMPSFQDIMTSVGTSLASVGSALGMILIYLLFMFIEQSTFNEKFARLFPTASQFKKFNFIISSIDSHMRKYLFIKTGVSLATAIATYILLIALGVEFAGVWAFLTFLLGYIPTFGAILATVLPMVYVFAMHGDLQTPIVILAGSIIINVLLGNILEPRLMGKSLNLSTLAILMNMVFWGMIWGALGMFFSVPILVMIMIVAAQFDKYRPIAVLLSADGKIPDKKEE